MKINKINITEEIIDKNNITEEVLNDEVSSEEVSDEVSSEEESSDEESSNDTIIKTHFEGIIKMIEEDDEKSNININIDGIINKYQKDINNLKMEIGDNVIKYMEAETEIDNINNQIDILQNKKDKIILSNNKSKIILDNVKIKCRKLIYNVNKLNKTNEKYNNKQIMDTMKKYAEFHKKNINEISLLNVINSSAGFNGWYKS